MEQRDFDPDRNDLDYPTFFLKLQPQMGPANDDNAAQKMLYQPTYRIYRGYCTQENTAISIFHGGKMGWGNLFLDDDNATIYVYQTMHSFEGSTLLGDILDYTG